MNLKLGLMGTIWPEKEKRVTRSGKRLSLSVIQSCTNQNFHLDHGTHADFSLPLTQSLIAVWAKRMREKYQWKRTDEKLSGAQ